MKCNHCGKDTNNPMYCSQSCSAKENNRKPKRTRTNKCKTCGKLILSNRSYCSKKCWSSNLKYMDWDTTTINEVRGKRKYQQSSVIRDNARRVYRKSGNPLVCQLCGYDKHVEICHRRPIKDFPLTSKISDVNSLVNLIALCPNHHWELDNNLLILDFTEFDNIHQ